MLPLIMSWPRGSNISPFLIQSYSARKCWRFSLMLFPCKTGPPPATSRTGLPQVCASMQKKVFFMGRAVVFCSTVVASHTCAVVIVFGIKVISIHLNYGDRETLKKHCDIVPPWFKYFLEWIDKLF